MPAAALGTENTSPEIIPVCWILKNHKCLVDTHTGRVHWRSCNQSKAHTKCWDPEWQRRCWISPWCGGMGRRETGAGHGQGCSAQQDPQLCLSWHKIFGIGDVPGMGQPLPVCRLLKKTSPEGVVSLGTKGNSFRYRGSSVWMLRAFVYRVP